VRAAAYTLLTSLICLLGRIRDRVHLYERMIVRFDRTLPWPTDGQPPGTLSLSCCDCGLAHVFLLDESGTPIRFDLCKMRRGRARPGILAGRNEMRISSDRALRTSVL